MDGKNVIKSIGLFGWVKLRRPGQVVPGRAEFRFGASGVGARQRDSSSTVQCRVRTGVHQITAKPLLGFNILI